MLNECLVCLLSNEAQAAWLYSFPCYSQFREIYMNCTIKVWLNYKWVLHTSMSRHKTGIVLFFFFLLCPQANMSSVVHHHTIPRCRNFIWPTACLSDCTVAIIKSLWTKQVALVFSVCTVPSLANQIPEEFLFGNKPRLELLPTGLHITTRHFGVAMNKSAVSELCCHVPLYQSGCTVARWGQRTTICRIKKRGENKVWCVLVGT